MNIVVPMTQVPDLVDEIEFNADATDIDRDAAKLQLSEWDDQALEEALLVKEATGGQVIAVALDGGDADQILFTALAKGADRAVKITGDLPSALDHHAIARTFASAIGKLEANLVMTGVQSVEDLDGQVPVLVAGTLGWPHVSVVTSVEASADKASVKQEYAGGVMAELDVSLPAVIGVQAARQAPRYAPVSKVRQIMKTAQLEEMPGEGGAGDSGIKVLRMYKPESGGRAEFLDGEPEDVAGKIVGILKERGLAL